MSSTISLPTSRNRDAGIVLFVLSVVVYFAVPPLAYEFGYNKGQIAVYSAPIGALLMFLGFLFVFLARKKVIVKDDVVTIKDGFLSRALNLRFEKTPTFKLAGHEEEKNGRIDEVFTVHMIDEGRQYLVDRRVGQQAACRSLAERLTKASGGSLIEVQEGKNYEFGLDELDLCFVSRAARHPELMGTPVEEPEEHPLSFEKSETGVTGAWSYFRSGLLVEIFMVTFCMVAAAFIPLPGGPDGKGFSLFEAELAAGDYRYFIGVGLFTVLSLTILAGYKNRIDVSLGSGVLSRTSIWGIPVGSGRVPLNELEHVAVTVNSRGPYLQLISDRKILSERLPSTEVARWLAWEIRKFLAGLSPEECQAKRSKAG